MISEIVTGLAAANQAVGLVKELQEIDRSVDEAGFKLKLADLTQLLADAKIALSEANLALNEKDTKIKQLQEDLETAQLGNVCPKCKIGRRRLETIEPQHMYGLNHFGVELWEMACGQEGCGFQHTDVHDPQGVVQNAAKQQMR